MAEIRVEKKDKNPIWPWILGALILIGLIWGVAELLGDDEPEMAATETETVDDRTAYQYEEDRVRNEAATAQGPVNEFVMFVERDGEMTDAERTNVSDRNAQGTTEMGMEHEYTAEGIRKLSAALNALAQSEEAGDMNIQQKRQDFQQKADRLQQDPQSLQHSNIIRETFVSAADLMQAIQEKSYPESDADVKEVREAAEEVKPSEQTLNQKEEVRSFFREASEAIQEMDEQRANRNTTTGQQNQ